MTFVTVRKDADDDYTVRVFGGVKWTFEGVINELKNNIPTFARSWEPDARVWRIRSDHFLHKWLDVVRARYDDAEIEWDFDHQRQRQQPPRQPKASRRDDAFKALHLLPTAPPELVRAAHKTLALLHHPDRGGDLERMKAVNNAFDVLKV